VYVDYVWDWPNFGRELGRTNYLGCGGAYGKVDPTDGANPPHNQQWAPFSGIYYISSATKISDITHWTSNTVSLFEHISRVWNGGRFFEIAWLGAGWIPTFAGIAPDSTDPAVVNWRAASSKHPGIINAAFADGSVRQLSKSGDYNTYIYITGMKDGRVTNFN